MANVKMGNIHEVVEFIESGRMGERTRQILNITIDKKLQSSFIVSCSRDELFKHATRPDSRLANLVSDRAFNAEKDLYNNKIYEFLNSAPSERKRTNILGYFRPGEILGSIMNQ